MALHKLKDTFGGIKGSLAAATLLATSALPFTANADVTPEDCKAVRSAPIKYNISSAMDAEHAADNYATCNDEVGMVIDFGEYNGENGKKITVSSAFSMGEKFASAAAGADKNLRYYIVEGGDPGFSITLYTKHTSLGPTSPTNAGKKFGGLLQENQRMERLLSSQASLN